MAVVYNPLVARLVARGLMANQEIINVTHWQQVSEVAPTVADLQDLAARYVSWWSTFISPIVGAGYTLNEIVVTAMDAPPALQIAFSDTLPAAGDAAGELLPANVAACVTVSGGTTGRSSRGRFYLAGLTENATVGSTFTVPTVAAINLAFSALLLDSEGEPFSGWELGIYSTELNSLPRPTGLFTPATSASLRDNIVDSQRRRLPGRGR